MTFRKGRIRISDSDRVLSLYGIERLTRVLVMIASPATSFPTSDWSEAHNEFIYISTCYSLSLSTAARIRWVDE